jgi:hypothetical protein
MIGLLPNHFLLDHYLALFEWRNNEIESSTFLEDCQIFCILKRKTYGEVCD